MATYAFARVALLETDDTLDFSHMPDQADTFATTFGPFDYTDFQPTNLNSATIDLGTLPAGFIITKVTVKHSTAFAGTGLTTAFVYIGVTGALRRITLDFDVKQATGNSKAQLVFGALGFDSSSATTMKVTLDTAGMTNGLDDLTAGEFNVCVEMIKAPTAMAGGDHWFRLGRGPAGAASIYWRPDDFNNGDLITYNSSLFKFTGLANTFAPLSAEYLVLNLDATLTNERQFLRGYHMVPTDGGPGSTYIPDIQYFGHDVHEFFDDLESIGRGVSLGTVASGTVAAVTAFASGSTRVGVADLNAGTDTTGYAAVVTDFVAYLASGGAMIFETALQIPVLSDIITPRHFHVRAGFGDANNADFTDGLYFEYDLNNSANWRYATAAAATRTKNNSTTAVTVNWVRLKIVVNSGGSSAEFFVDGSSVGTITTNIPTTAGQEFGALVHIMKESGTLARSVYVDYIGVRKVFASARSAEWPR